LASVDEEAGDGHVIGGKLVCASAGHTFPVAGGVARLLPGAAERSAARDQTAQRFGYAWKRFADFDPGQERTSMATWFSPHALADLAGTTVLDAGCGMGRHAVLAVQHGARRVVGLDLGDAVDAAFANTRHLSEVCIVQGDIYHPPLRPAVFDAAYALGVLHHLPDPARGFARLVPAIRADGWFQVWLYGREGNGWILLLVNPIRRLSARLPLGPLRMLCAGLGVPVFLFARLARSAPWLAARMTYGEYLRWLGGFGFRKVYAIVFDHALAPVAHYLSRVEVEDLVANAGWRIAGLEHSRRMSWGVDARPPARGTPEELSGGRA